MFDFGESSIFPRAYDGITIEDMDELRHYIAWTHRCPYDLVFEEDEWDESKWLKYIKKWTKTDY